MDIKQLIPMPDLQNCKSILCIQPHPDDNETGAGAAIAKLAASGCDVTYLTVTDGRVGTIDPDVFVGKMVATRREEAETAAKVLGVKRTIYFDYPDAAYIDEKELTSRIVKVIREIKPEFVMTVDPFLPYEAHPDHRRVGMAASEACLFSVFPNFRSYGETFPGESWDVKGVAFYNTAYPNTFIDIANTWDLKMQSIGAHSSQFSGEMFELYKMYFGFKAQELGKAHGFELAEGFKVFTPMLLHANVDAINW
jgi:LmbE family N-acetylglucosaminyl deacetylase